MSKKVIKNYTELFEAMNEIQFIALQILADKVQEMWIQYTQERWYDQYDPQVYERTFAIIQAIIQTGLTQIGKNKFKIDVYIDMDVMNHYHPNTQGVIDGEETVNLIENIGHAFGGDEREGTHAFEDIVEWLRVDYEKFLLRELPAYGYDLK
jgi:hypothetical protein